VPDVARPGTGFGGANLLRDRLGLAQTVRIVLFEGRLGPNLGLDESAEAILRVPHAVLVLIGFGRWTHLCASRDTEPRFVGRHFTLPAVHPDEVLAMAASADVALVPLPPVSENQRLSTPNKFWEAIAAGTPLVIGPDLPVMAELVHRYELGVIAPSLGPRDLAAAIESVLDVDSKEASARRRRIEAVARVNFSWAAAARRYRDLVSGVVSGTETTITS